MVKAYKLPEDLDLQEFVDLMSTFKAPLTINPVKDINGKYFISEEEWNLPEWQVVKQKYPDITSQFSYEEFVFNPKVLEFPPMPDNPDNQEE